MPAAPANPRSDLDLKRFRRLLEKEKARTTSQLARLDADNETGGTAGETSELADYDQHNADQGTELFLREKDEAIHESLRQELDQVEAALRKLDKGTYGYCDRCGSEIIRERLEVLPAALYCIQCAGDIGSLAP